MKKHPIKTITSLASKQGCDNKPMLFDNEIWLDTTEAAEYLRISVNSLRIRICRGEILPYRLGRRLRFQRSQLDKLVTSSLSRR